MALCFIRVVFEELSHLSRLSRLSCGVGGRDRRGQFLDDAVDLGLGDAQDGCDLADGLALALEFGDVVALDFAGLVGAVAEVFGLDAEFQELEVDEAAFVGNLVDEDVVAAEFLLAGADLELLDVAETVVLGGLADGHDGVEVVEEALGAGEVVLGDGAGEAALGRVGDDQEAPAVLALEGEEVHHELGRVNAFVGVGAEVADVVDDAGLAAGAEHGFLDALEDAGFVVLGLDGGRVDLGAVEALRELVEQAGVPVGVAELELLLGEFAVQVEDGALGGDVFGDLDGEDGFTEVGVREEAADFPFEPERVEEFVGVGARGGVFEGLVGGLDGEHVHLLGVLAGFDRLGYRLYGVCGHGYRRLCL